MNHLSHAIALIGGPTKVASLLGVSAQAVCFWRDGRRQMPVQYCALIEKATQGQVTRRLLRPNDWQVIWPELQAANDAAHPAQPSPQQEAA